MTTLDDRFADHLADLAGRQARTRPTGVPSEVVYPVGEVTLPEHVDHWANMRPDQPAFVCDGVTRTWAQFADDVRRAAGGLRALGVRPGDRVAVDLPNSLEFVVTMMAALRLGAVHVPVNPMFTARELRYEIDDSGAMLLVTCPALMASAGSGLAGSALRHVVMTTWGPDVPYDLGDLDVVAWQDLTHDGDDACATDLDALAALNYTGGTTGFPDRKSVV